MPKLAQQQLQSLSAAFDPAVVARYRANYGLGSVIGPDHVAHHVALEGALTAELRASTSETRWETFERAYGRLYAELPWLNSGELEDDTVAFAQWARVLAGGPHVLEIGPGRGALLRRLAALGHACTGAEITRERGLRQAGDIPGVTWSVTDGVHLDHFAPAGAYDAVISRQVIEHLHPDDLPQHLASARAVLKPGGRYLFETPHRGTGPHDLSKPLGLQRPAFMHLKEYDYAELLALTRRAGFARVEAIYARGGFVTASASLMRFYAAVDRAIAALRLAPRVERRLRRSAPMRLLGPRSTIWIAATAGP